jgi:hypothetical protein
VLRNCFRFRGIADMAGPVADTTRSLMPSRPGEFHPGPLTDPDLRLSRHPARATARRLPPSTEQRAPPGEPVGPNQRRWPTSFAPAPLQDLRRYYEAVRPSPTHRYFRPRGGSRLHLFPWHRRQGSHVPYRSLIELRAAYTPDAARSVSGHPPSLSRRMGQPAVLTSPNPISTLQKQFACARLSRSCLPGSSPRRFRDANDRGF